MGCVLRSSNKLITLYIYIYLLYYMYWFPVCLGVSFLSMKSYYLSKKKNIICIGWVQVTFSNGTSLNIFLLDVYFD